MGIMHRDLKPENVLISLGPGLELEGSHLRITDFGHAWQAPGDSLDKQMLGLSQKAEPGQPLHWQRVYSNRWIGTLEYMAPEVHKREAYGPMVDWWTLGHLAYDIFTGQVRASLHRAPRGPLTSRFYIRSRCFPTSAPCTTS